LKFTYDDNKKWEKQEYINLNNNLIESFSIFKYSDDHLLIEEISYAMGEQYELSPLAMGRTGSDYMSKKYQYEFY